jgi:hypothetical protein
LPTAEPFPKEEAQCPPEPASTILTLKQNSKYKSMVRVSTTVVSVQLIWPAMASKYKEFSLGDLLAESRKW